MQTMFPPTAAVGFQGHPTNTPAANQNVIRHNCRVALIGTKVQSPLMNICRSCNSPIILHGRFVSLFGCFLRFRLASRVKLEHILLKCDFFFEKSENLFLIFRGLTFDFFQLSSFLLLNGRPTPLFTAKV